MKKVSLLLIILLSLFMFIPLIKINTVKAEGSITYTQLPFGNIITPTAGSWQDVNVTSSYNIPFNAVLETWCWQSRSDGERVAGVREDGSTLDRRFFISRGTYNNERGGRLPVQVSSEGIIEAIISTSTNVGVELMGYWEGIVFTEQYEELSIELNSTWNIYDMSTLTDGVSGRRVYVMSLQRRSAYTTYVNFGVRSYGSSVNRLISYSRGSGLTYNSVPCTMCVETDTNSLIEYYCDPQTTISAANHSILSLGYYGSQLSYNEDFYDFSKASTGSYEWVNSDLTDADSGFPSGEQIIEFWSGNNATSSKAVGVRNVDDETDGCRTTMDRPVYSTIGDQHIGLTFIAIAKDGDIEWFAYNPAYNQAWYFGYFTTGDYPYLLTDSTGNTNNENGDSLTLYSFWYMKSGELSGFIYEYNMTGSFINSTWSVFSDNNSTWGNHTFILNSDNLGDTIYYRIYANSSNNDFTVTEYFNFTVQATVTFYHNSGGIIYRNSTLCSNTTQTTYTTPTNLEIIAICNSTYGYYNMTWHNNLNYTILNPYNYQVQNRTDFNVLFGAIGSGEPSATPAPTPTGSPTGEYTVNDLQDYFLFGVIVSAIIFILVSVVFIGNNKRKGW